MKARPTRRIVNETHRRWFFWAVVLTSLASMTHIIAAPEHFEEWVGYGMFFLISAAAQGVYALLLLYLGPGHRPLLWAGIIGNALIIGLYLVTRTVGIPLFGPEAGVVESVGLVDLASKVFELGLIVCLVQMMRIGEAARRVAS